EGLLGLVASCANLDPYLYKNQALSLITGIGIGGAMNAAEGFGILCLASIGPIISVMVTGLWAQYQDKLQTSQTTQINSLFHEQEAPSII
ncbi:MAG: DUF1538 domain-containing protein, partial [gamma proteobacterium symbiont of Lucinoma myriamae]|nr:DUF1538 domain-containing protein [gamma proteobacterium symbiont of Lucinoma myriamae]